MEVPAADKVGSDSIRAFVAIGLSDEVKADLERQVATLRQANVRGLRLVRPEAVHLTLKFLGEVSHPQVVQVSEAVKCVSADHEPFSLGLADVGMFPPRGPARVLWVGIGGNVEALAALQRDVEEALTAVGFAKEGRRFTPHLTLARINDNATFDDRKKAADVHRTAWSPSGHRMHADALNLMRSYLNADGATYERLARIPLGRRAVRGSAG